MYAILFLVLEIPVLRIFIIPAVFSPIESCFGWKKKKIIPLNETISWVLGSKICFKSKSAKVGPITWHFYFLSFSTPLFGLNILDGGVIMILEKRKKREGEINLEFKWNKGFGFFACYGRREFILQAMLFCFFYFEKVRIILLIVPQWKLLKFNKRKSSVQTIINKWHIPLCGEKVQ